MRYSIRKAGYSSPSWSGGCRTTWWGTFISISKSRKGFMKEVAGCVERSETAYWCFLDARHHHQDLCVSWVDLANAYGSLKHALIHFALEWYHVPEHFRELIFNCYERLSARVLVGTLLSACFWFSSGVFQGCPPSSSTQDSTHHFNI